MKLLLSRKGRGRRRERHRKRERESRRQPRCSDVQLPYGVDLDRIDSRGNVNICVGVPRVGRGLRR